MISSPISTGRLKPSLPAAGSRTLPPILALVLEKLVVLGGTVCERFLPAYDNPLPDSSHRWSKNSPGDVVCRRNLSHGRSSQIAQI